MRYQCLILDHDDTAIDGTRLVHYPAHVRAMEVLRPGQTPVNLETWFAKNFEPGILGFLVGELGFTPEEMEVEHAIWREHTGRETPSFYPGFLEAIATFQSRGGAIVVASHSEENVIRSHYWAAANGHSVVPDLVFGWDLGPERRKPHPYPVLETLDRLNLSPTEVLVVDDLKPGIDMALAAGVDAAGVGWSHNIPQIREFMARTCVATFDSVSEFAAFILD
jgi:phosphoglycolate phosphatase/pyrophosphatase PpaX